MLQIKSSFQKEFAFLTVIAIVVLAVNIEVEVEEVQAVAFVWKPFTRV